MHSALLLIDVQNDFITGSLKIPSASHILPTLHSLLLKPFNLIIASQDSHPQNHISFATSHPPAQPFTTISLLHPLTHERIEQELWPVHCVQGSFGEGIEESIQSRLGSLEGRVEIVRKGFELEKDVYSAFEGEFNGNGNSKLTELLLQAEIKNIIIVGVATDFCVKASVLSALAEAKTAKDPWVVYVVREGCKGVNGEEAALEIMEKAGAKIINLEQVDGILI